MDNYEYSEIIKNLEEKLQNIEDIIDPQALESRNKEIEQMQNDPAFWEDSSKAAKIGQEKTRIEKVLASFHTLQTDLKDAKELFDLAKEEEDESTLQTLFEEVPRLQKSIKDLEIAVMLDGPHDDSNAIVSIHPGAGGTESQDWADMLFRMYMRWAERRGFGVEILDKQAGEEAGIKDVSFLIKGENAYGYLKAENGVHRLVRISPFDSNARRHTSFSSVMVSPEIDDDIEIEIEDKDLRIDTYRASGAGGQHVNKTESAIRITHQPSGIVVQCQNDRSQHKNKATAMKMLKSRLYEIELEKKQARADGMEKSEIGWGHQIRSYVLAPYQQIKDSRSNQAYSNVENILDGDLDDVIEGVLIAGQK
ncbi:MAG: peptide chain release factor 2 [Campylobacterota bacterium]